MNATPMNFEYLRPPTDYLPGEQRKSGDYCYKVQLSDGREAMFVVQGAEVYNGTLKLEDRNGELCVAFAPGTWLCVYQADAAGGAPIGMDWIDAPLKGEGD